MVLVGGALGRGISHEGGVLMNGINTLIIFRLQRLTLPHVRTKQEGDGSEPRGRPSAEGDHANTLILDCLASGAVSHKCLLFINYSVIFCYSSPNRLSTA